MNINTYITALTQYGLSKGLFQPCDKIIIIRQLLDILMLTDYEPVETRLLPLEDILNGLTVDAISRRVCNDDNASRDLFSTKLMGVMTPPPKDVIKNFYDMYEQSPETATNWYYCFSQDTDYIRRYRIQKDIRWKTATEYGNLDITINLSKPEKNAMVITAAGQNHRAIPLLLDNEEWYMQYSPHVCYPEHCIVFNGGHTPMVINKATLNKLLDFVTKFPHYFIGSNADLPILGSKNLTYEHFQGGHYSFPIARAPIEQKIFFCNYEDISAGIVKWPMSVIRLSSTNKERLSDLATKILLCWRIYNDKKAFIFSKTDNEPHNTITPIARRRGTDYELDLVLRNNITTKEHPLGFFHPHAELHHIKKDNIGLIEVMGLAVLPARLKQELTDIEQAIICGTPLEGELSKHEAWVFELNQKYTFSPENIDSILKVEIGKVFTQALKHAGVFKHTPEGVEAFSRFIEYVNQEE